MKIFLAHNYYQKPGGEDGCFQADASVLEEHGHFVHRYTAYNKDVNTMSKAQIARTTLWNNRVYDELREIFSRETFDVAHFHNYFPLISPSAYYAARDAGIPVIQMLNNFRIICPGSLLYRNGHVCEDCIGQTFALPSIIHGCYHKSRTETGLVAVMNSVHQLQSTWHSVINHYIAPTEFTRQKFIQAGFPDDKITVCQYYLQVDPGTRHEQGDYALFVGRLTQEKGVLTLLEAWRCFNYIPLKIVGDGPLKNKIEAFVAEHNLNVELISWMEASEVIEKIKGARFIIFPSLWYETFGRVIVEAFACGVPVITSDIGAPPELVEHQVTGLHFRAGDPESLIDSVNELWSDPAKTYEMGRLARHEFESKYTAEKGFQRLIQLFDSLSLKRETV